jgi:hypothetical protein
MNASWHAIAKERRAEIMIKARYEQGLIPQNIIGNVKLSRKNGNRVSCASWKKCKKLLSLSVRKRRNTVDSMFISCYTEEN